MRPAPLLLLLAACPNHPPRYERGPQNRPPPSTAVTCADDGTWELRLVQTSAAEDGCEELLLAESHLGLGAGASLSRDAAGWHLGALKVELDAASEQACTPLLHVTGQSELFGSIGAESGEIGFDLVVDGDQVTGTATTVAVFEGKTCTFTYDVGGGAALRDEVACGDKSCGPDEYCELRCTCCGMRLPDPGEASGTATCLPLPDSCRTADGPECQQRTVEVPCA